MLHASDDLMLNLYANTELPADVFHSSLTTPHSKKCNDAKESKSQSNKKQKVWHEVTRTNVMVQMATSLSVFYEHTKE